MLALGAATVLSAGWRIFPGAIAAGRRGILDMHVLMALAAFGALVIGEYVEAGAVLFLFAVARELERKTLNRARSEVRSLMDLAPVEATVLRHGHHVAVPVEAVRRGELVLVRPGERVPVDGTVVSGSSEVDASAITGESMPEAKFKDDRVFAGSVNGSGALEILCDQTSEDSALGRVLKSLERARSQKSPTETFVDQFAKIYTPLVIGGAVLLATLPPLLGAGLWSEWGYRALVLVVIACPCALVISTPVTVVSALTGAARRGILVKSGTHLEVLGKTRVVALDKTGTLTEGRPRVAEVLSWDDTAREEILRFAAAAESRSEHPIAYAILAAAKSAAVSVPDASEMTSMPGRGARARVEGRTVVLGSPRLFREIRLLDSSGEARISEVESRGSTIVLVGWGEADTSSEQLRGALVLMDTVRRGMSSLLPALRKQGVDRIVCVSGDRGPAVETAVRSVGEGQAGFDEWRGDLLPEEKVSWIHELRNVHGPVLMVGDGVNDAPALAAADVGDGDGGGRYRPRLGYSRRRAHGGRTQPHPGSFRTGEKGGTNHPREHRVRARSKAGVCRSRRCWTRQSLDGSCGGYGFKPRRDPERPACPEGLRRVVQILSCGLLLSVPGEARAILVTQSADPHLLRVSFHTRHPMPRAFPISRLSRPSGRR